MIKKIQSVLTNRLGALEQKLINALVNRKKTIVHQQHKLSFCTPNALNRYRVNSFSTKEPETLGWIDNFNDNAILWDIGANVGLYSIYAAKAKNAQVFAFEPSVFNLELLAKNISINKLQENITIFPIALSSKMGVNLFNMHNPVWGGALSTFGQDYDQNGDKMQTNFSYNIPGISGDEVVNTLNTPKPNHLKIDVDGIEHLILSGCENILKSINSVLIEINDDFLVQKQQSEQYLSQAGLILKQKFILGDNSNQYNQLWIRG